MVPGQHVVVDKCMSSWTRSDAEYVAEGMPHKTKIVQKAGVGAELKAMACGLTGILLKLDIMEGKEANHLKPFSAEYGESTAVVLRLCSSLFGTGRNVHADSAFSSVKTLIALGERGLYFQRMVKTAHKEYPMGFMKDWENGLEEGECHQDESGVCWTPRNTNMNALCWKDRKLKTIISNAGTTLPENPSKRK